MMLLALTISFCAVLCALATMSLITPLVRTHKRTAMAILVLMPGVSLGLYSLLGSAGMPSRPALFETDANVIEARKQVTRELETMRQLSKDPDNVLLIMRLAGVRMGQGKLDGAIELLNSSIARLPDAEQLRMQLGAALFSKSVMLMRARRFAEALQTLRRCKAVTPEGTPFLKDVDALIAALEKLVRKGGT